jgi:hypothetical protein
VRRFRIESSKNAFSGVSTQAVRLYALNCDDFVDETDFYFCFLIDFVREGSVNSELFITFAHKE